MNQLLTPSELPARLCVCYRLLGVRRSTHIRLVILLLSGFTAFSVSGCSRPVESSNLVTVQSAFSREPPQVGLNTLTLKLTDRDAKPVSGARITVEADMSHPGMAPELGEARETEPGRYLADLKFEMAGDWVVLLHVRLPGGQLLERQFNVSGVRPD